MEHLKIVIELYRHLIKQLNEGIIPIDLRAKSIIGTVQDDPFDCWVEENLNDILPDYFEIFHSGSLTTPDLVVRDTVTGAMLGLEIKKLIQKSNGQDSRGLTMDYNSCLPCGSAMIKVGRESIAIPCFYLFALLSPDSNSIVTLILMDGDFLNYDFNLHKEAKTANTTEYNHGPYGEGSVRHRRMYTYPNPLNYKHSFFHLRQVLVAKKHDLSVVGEDDHVTDVIVREDIYGNAFHYVIKDETIDPVAVEQVPIHNDIFVKCKKRSPKERVAAVPFLPPLTT